MKWKQIGTSKAEDGVVAVQLEKDAAVETLPNAENEKRFHNDVDAISGIGHNSSTSTTTTTTTGKDPLEYDYRFEKEVESNIEEEESLEHGVHGGAVDDSKNNNSNKNNNNKNNSHQIPSKCVHVPESGSGSKIIKSYFFNVESGKCERFYYSGRGGNENRFEALQDCVDTCVGA